MLFAYPRDERLDAKWVSGANDYVDGPEGLFHQQFFTRPFKCAVRRSQMADILWAGGHVCLISNRVKELFLSAKLTGYDLRPGDVRLMFPHDPNDAVYWQLILTGWGGIASPRSGIHRIDDPEGAGRLTYTPCLNPAAIIDASQWDGSDFFFVWPLPNFWWVTPRVADLLHEHKLKRFRLVPPSELKFGIQVGEVGFSPGRLRHYFTEERAKVIGEPLGIY
jgi:hypothetical protein